MAHLWELYENEGNPKVAYPQVEAADIPTLPAYDTGLNYKDWCEHCRVWHLHARMDGHRAAHCYWPLSPYNSLDIAVQDGSGDLKGYGKSDAVHYK
jgi:hypothetical protein